MDIPSKLNPSTYSKTQSMTSVTSGFKSCVTSTEQSKFLSAIKDSKFRSLLNDYIHDRTDVLNHDETVHRLSQLQNEPNVLKTKQVVQIQPGFVVKTKYDNRQKVFINVCSSDKMPPPNIKVTTDQQRSSWTLPYSLGPERLEMDKRGADVPTFDVCFHPQVVEFAIAQVDYRHMVITTCFDAIEHTIRDSRCKPSVQLARKYHILKGMYYKSGDPIPMWLRKKDREVTEMSKSKMVKSLQAKNKTKVDISQENSLMLDDKESIMAAMNQADDPESMHAEQADHSTSLIEERSTSDFDPKRKAGKIQQKKKLEHELAYRGRFEHLHDVQADPDNQASGDGYRPKELVVEVNIPRSTSAKGKDLDVSERMLQLSTDRSEVGGTALMVANDPQAMARIQRQAQRHPSTAVTRSSQAVMTDLAAIKDDAVFDDRPPLKSCGGEEIDTSEVRAEETKSSLSMSASIIESASKAVVDPIKPPFETHNTLKCLAYIVNVAGIDSASVKLTLPSNRWLRLQFLDSDKQAYEMHVAILPVDVDSSTAEFDVASENMVIILHKKFAATASAA